MGENKMMSNFAKMVVREFGHLIKKDEQGHRYISIEEIDKLNIPDDKKNVVKLAFAMRGVEVVDKPVETIERPKRVRDLNYGEVEDNGLGHLDKPKIAKIEYQGEELVAEDYEKLDDFILNEFVPENVQMKVNFSKNRKDSETTKPYASIQLGRIVDLGLSEKELKHVLELLDSEGIHVGGMAAEIESETRLYDYIPTGDIVQQYRKKFLSDKLTREQIQEKFIKFFETKDPLLREELILRNLGLVDYCTWKIAKRHDIDINTLRSYGYEGLIYAVDRYDPYLENAFSSYAVPCIEGFEKAGVPEIKEIVDENLYYKIMAVKRIVEQENGMKIEEDPTLVDDMVKIIVSSGYIGNDSYYGRIKGKNLKKYILNHILGATSFEEFAEKNDIVLDESEAIDTDGLKIEAFMDYINKDVKGHLTPREYAVIKLRYGLDGVGPHTLQEVGKILGVTRARIRQIEIRALRRICNIMYRNGSKGVLEDMYDEVDIADKTRIPKDTFEDEYDIPEELDSSSSGNVRKL